LQAHASATIKMPTPVLTRLMHDAASTRRQAGTGAFRPKMRYAHQGGMNPPIVVIHGNCLEHVTDVYKRYLEGRMREHFKLTGHADAHRDAIGSNPFDEG
jgi:GTP-binding protein